MKEQETRTFQSEVKQLLHLMIHSLYSNKEIFLRELISNASDAADKLRFYALSKPDLYEGNSNLYIRLFYNTEMRTITIIDNGIGMKKDEIIDNLGTIAKSGTKHFLESIKSDHIKNNQLIGQFGVGFYSSFVVAEKVVVRSRAAGVSFNEGVLWESTGEDSYTITNIDKSERGTEVTLYLRKGEEEFLNNQRLKNIISKYSDHILLPIEIKNDSKDEKNKNNNKEDVIWEKVNKAQALWTRNKIDISDDEYKEFYKYISHDFNDPIKWSHNRVEGKQEYTCLLYIPSKAPWNIWNREHKHGLKLYVRRVFIMDDAEQFLPNYLRFVKGVIDSNDLPLNISREMLQDQEISKNLKSSINKRILIMLEKLSQDNPDQYQTFWQQFGLILKEGPAEDNTNKEIILKLLRFASTAIDTYKQTVSLKEYIERMKPQQEKIYYITADSYNAAKNSPHLELLRKKEFEVLLLSDRIDEWMMSYIVEFEGKTFQSIRKPDPVLDKICNEENEEQKNIKKTMQPFIERIKKYLGERIKDVRLTNRLFDTPTIVSTETNSMTTQMARLFTAAGQTVPEIKYILEINPEHILIKRIFKIKDNNLFCEWIELLLEQALLVELGTLEDPNKFICRINNLLIT